MKITFDINNKTIEVSEINSDVNFNDIKTSLDVYLNFNWEEFKLSLSYASKLPSHAYYAGIKPFTPLDISINKDKRIDPSEIINNKNTINSFFYRNEIKK